MNVHSKKLTYKGNYEPIKILRELQKLLVRKVTFRKRTFQKRQTFYSGCVTQVLSQDFREPKTMLKNGPFFE